MNKARKELWNCDDELDILKEVVIPVGLEARLYKCRILYGEGIRKVEFLPYRLPAIRSLKLIYNDEISYHYKYENREAINALYACKDTCDDILIVKNGLLTDTSYCNIVLSDGVNYHTPANPLLHGTKRQQLLQEQKITEACISVDQLKFYHTIYLINAMLELEDNVCLSTDQVY
ncbi:MAG: hypothetical protein INR73_17560 [Williamsia sp.]|nr:hypothetical protein [Williamsia sp.]